MLSSRKPRPCHAPAAGSSEWLVRSDDPMLFRYPEEPQAERAVPPGWPVPLATAGCIAAVIVLLVL